jgi:hypothetical protein
MVSAQNFWFPRYFPVPFLPMCKIGDGSDAQRLLKEDVESGLTMHLDPSFLRETRLEYKVFPLKVFRDHIYQEVRLKTGSSYWMNRSKKGKTHENGAQDET